MYKNINIMPQHQQQEWGFDAIGLPFDSLTVKGEESPGDYAPPGGACYACGTNSKPLTTIRNEKECLALNDTATYGKHGMYAWGDPKQNRFNACARVIDPKLSKEFLSSNTPPSLVNPQLHNICKCEGSSGTEMDVAGEDMNMHTWEWIRANADLEVDAFATNPQSLLAIPHGDDVSCADACGMTQHSGGENTVGVQPLMYQDRGSYNRSGYYTML